MKRLKKILLLFFALLYATAAFAQYVPDWHQGELRRRGTRLAIQNEKLDKDSTLAILSGVGGPEMAASWEKASLERGWGIGLTAGGFTLAAAGFALSGIYLVGGVIVAIFASIGGQSAVDNAWSELEPMVQIGTVGLCTGLVAGTTGIVLLSRGNSNLRKITRICDAAGLPPVPAAEVSFGPTPSGVGFAFRF